MDFTSNKINESHLSKLAMLYVRQSTIKQVNKNTESGKRQRNLFNKAISLGFKSESVILIDSDQGQSGSSAIHREGFSYLVSEVSLNKVGLVLGLEVSRLARNNADWQRLIEICALTNTLILDEDGLYDPNDFNDRLLLGLKGTMSEAELHFIKARLRGGQISKAKRGELKMPLPVGFVYDLNDNVLLDPDINVRNAINHLFNTFFKTQSARRTVGEFNQNNLLFPSKALYGPHKGETLWGPLKHWRVLRTLKNPRYAGAYSYGKLKTKRTIEGKVRFEPVPRESWVSFFKDAHDGYITFEQFEQIEKIIVANRSTSKLENAKTPIGSGPALIQGRVICGICGHRMTVGYHKRYDTLVPEYRCSEKLVRDGGKMCQAIPGGTVDSLIVDICIKQLTPIEIDVAFKIQEELEANFQQIDNLKKGNLQKLKELSEANKRRYHLVDPANRLVADSLEKDYNESLKHLYEASQEYDTWALSQTSKLTEDIKDKVRSLVQNIGSVFSNETTSNLDKKRIIGLIIEDVTLTKKDTIHVDIRFRGGRLWGHEIEIPPSGGLARQTNKVVVEKVDELLNSYTDIEIAQILNDEGYKSGMGRSFNVTIVREIRKNYKLKSRRIRLEEMGLVDSRQLATILNVSDCTIKIWSRAGIIPFHKVTDRGFRMYDTKELDFDKLVKMQGKPIKNRDHALSENLGAS